MLHTKKEVLEFGCFIMNRPVLKEYEEFKKTSIFSESEFILIDFGVFLGLTPLEVKYELMKWGNQIEQFEEVFKY